MRQFVSIAVVVVALALSACASEGTETCDQECMDSYTAFTVVDTVVFLYNQNVAGTPGGSVNLQRTCPAGGNVHITGTASGSTSTTSVDLDYAMQDCRRVGADYDVTFTGTIAEVGTISDSGSTVTFSGTAVVFDGNNGAGAVAETCDIAISRANGAYSGTICGRAFSY